MISLAGYPLQAAVILCKIVYDKNEWIFRQLCRKDTDMQQITEQQILMLAPNPAAAGNGKKISQKGGFVRLERSGDDTFYLGECTGSGKSNYITTADFMDPQAPVFRCSCPSRQFPCKHSLALLYEIMARKSFTLCEIPEDILKKREKKLARAAKAQEDGADGAGGESSAEAKKASREGAASKGKKASGAGKAARARKQKKQLEGLDLVEGMMRELLLAGLGTMGGTTSSSFRQLSKQLGDYYLPGPQRLLNRLILETEAYQRDRQEIHYDNALETLEALRTLVKKSRIWLQEKLESGGDGLEDSPLYEELGGVWRLSELEEIGNCRRNVRLVQLSFHVEYDEAAREYTDMGCWADVATGEISLTCNYRPVKALKYVKQEDSIFGAANVEAAMLYPGEGNRRIRWEHARITEVTEEDRRALCALAGRSLAAEAKAAKNLLKNALADPVYYRLIAFERIGQTEDGLALLDEQGESVLLGNPKGMEGTTDRLFLLPDGRLLKKQTLLGGFYYDRAERRLKLWPLSIVTKRGIIRLLY